jgi:hypothetical protein
MSATGFAPRYTAFILNYPTGFVAESSILVLGLPYLRQRDMYSVHLPNKANWGFDYVWFMMVSRRAGSGQQPADRRQQLLGMHVCLCQAHRGSHHPPQPCMQPLPECWHLIGMALQIVLAVYPFLWWQQYSALLRSRSKKLAGGKQKSS